MALMHACRFAKCFYRDSENTADASCMSGFCAYMTQVDARRFARFSRTLQQIPKRLPPHYLQKKTPLSFDIGKTTVLHTASLRLCSFLARHFCSNVGTIVLCQCRCCKARHLRDSRKRFHFLRQALSCRVSSAKEHQHSSDSVSAAINEKARGLHL